MRGVLIAPALMVAALSLAGCSGSPEDATSDFADAWKSSDVEAVVKLSSGTISQDQRDVLADAMERCKVDPNSAVDVPGGTSDMVRAWAIVADCEGTRSLLAGNLTTDNEEGAWRFNAADLPGGGNSDFSPSALPAEMRGLPKVGE